MPIIPEVLDSLDERTRIRRDTHAQPKCGSQVWLGNRPGRAAVLCMTPNAISTIRRWPAA